MKNHTHCKLCGQVIESVKQEPEDVNLEKCIYSDTCLVSNNCNNGDNKLCLGANLVEGYKWRWISDNTILGGTRGEEGSN